MDYLHILALNTSPSVFPTSSPSGCRCDVDETKVVCIVTRVLHDPICVHRSSRVDNGNSVDSTS